MSHIQETVMVAENGRLCIPARQRKLLGLESGGKVVLRLENGVLTLRPVAHILAEIQEMARQQWPDGGGPTVDSFIAERRAEAAREAQEAQALPSHPAAPG